jgi:hypothetical protein
VRLFLRKSRVGCGGSVSTRSENAVSCQRSICLALRLITAKRPVRRVRVKRVMRTKLLLVTATSPRKHGPFPPFRIVASLSLLFHEGAQNLWATPPVRCSYCLLILIVGGRDQYHGPDAPSLTLMPNLLRGRVAMNGGRVRRQGSANSVSCGVLRTARFIVRGCYLYRSNLGWFSLSELTFI